MHKSERQLIALRLLAYLFKVQRSKTRKSRREAARKARLSRTVFNCVEHWEANKVKPELVVQAVHSLRFRGEDRDTVFRELLVVFPKLNVDSFHRVARVANRLPCHSWGSFRR